MKKKIKRVNRILHNPWFIGITLYLLGLISPKTISGIKLVLFESKTTVTHIENVKYMNLGLGNRYLNSYLFIALFILLAMLAVFSYYSED